ncbi:MAX network transcriptional repressor b [Engraulis encrasicolus]|uniref:MAX network transcriptional repressor b n=1 Tax=Engraulis encrasicolus TaxID=184585 RepID=UPI002FD4C72A
MSIDTLLEAARYLEWQAQQQQITREEEKKRENAIVAREADQLVRQLQQHCMAENGASLVPAAVQVNHLSWGVEAPRLVQQPPHPQQQQQQQPHLQHQHQHQQPQHIQAVATGAALPITVIPISMVQANAAAPQTITTTTIAGAAAAPTHLAHAAAPMTLATALSPQPAQLLASPVSHQPSAVVVTAAAAGGAAAATTVVKDRQSQSPPNQHQHQHQRHLVAAVKGETSILPQPTLGSQAASGSSPKQQQQQHSPQRPPVTLTHPQPHAPPHAQLLQTYPGQILTSPAQHQHQHALLPQPATALAQSHQAQLGQVTQRPNGASLEDVRSMDAKRRPGGAGTREVHNKLEKHRRAHLKECFETLKRNVPNVDEKKTSNLSVLRSALRYIQTLKRKEKEFEHEMERLAREKIATQQRLAELKKDLSQSMDALEIDRLLRQTVQPEDDQASTSTASEGEDNFDQDIDGDVPSSASSGAPSASPKPPHHHHPPSYPSPAGTMPPLTLLPAPGPQHQPRAVQPAPLTLPQHITIHSHKLTPVAQAMTVVSPLPTVTVSSSPQPQTVVAAAAAPVPQAIAPATPPPQPTAIPVSTHLVMPQAPGQHPHPHAQQATVIAHASVSHASVIQAVNHVLPVAAGTTTKHLAHIAPSGGAVMAAAAAPVGGGVVTTATTLPMPMSVPVSTTVTAMGQPIGHITVAHLSPHLPVNVNAVPMNVNMNGATLYPAQQVAVSQPAVVGHIAHALAAHHQQQQQQQHHHHHHHPHPQHHPHHAGHHAQVNGITPVSVAVAGTQGTPGATATMVTGKGATVVTAHHHHPQLVGQTVPVLNPVTMVTVPQFPVSTLKLA